MGGQKVTFFENRPRGGRAKPNKTEPFPQNGSTNPTRTRSKRVNSGAKTAQKRAKPGAKHPGTGRKIAQTVTFHPSGQTRQHRQPAHRPLFDALRERQPFRRRRDQPRSTPASPIQVSRDSSMPFPPHNHAVREQQDHLGSPRYYILIAKRSKRHDFSARPVTTPFEPHWAMHTAADPKPPCTERDRFVYKPP